MEDLQYQKLKKAILKLRSENEYLKSEIEKLIEKEKKNEKTKKDELDEWFSDEDETENE